jgi:hypothetical protein
MTLTSTNERLAIVEQRLSDHESRCEERLAEIKATAASTLRAVEGLKTRSWSVAVALLAWALAQIWTSSQSRIDRLEAIDQIEVAQGATLPATGRSALPAPP